MATEQGVIIVEDDKDIAYGIEQYLIKKTNFKKEQVIHVKNVPDWRRISEEKRHFAHIIDLDLGTRKKQQEGINLIAELNEIGKDIGKIIYTAHDNPQDKRKCIDMGVAEDHFISKKNLETDVDIIANLLTKDGVEKKKFISKVPSRFVVEHIHIYTNFLENYNSLPFAARLSICKFFLQPIDKGYFYYILDNLIIEGNASKSDEIEESIKDRAILTLQQHIGKSDQTLLNLLLFEKKSTSLELNLSNWDEITHEIDSTSSTSANKQSTEEKKHACINSSFCADIRQYFIAQRLCELYIFNYEESDRSKVIELGTHLVEEKGKMELITQLWEWITIHKTGDIGETNALLDAFYRQGYPMIEDIFYCQVEERNDEENIAYAIVASAEDVENTFTRAFDLGMLAQSGVGNSKATFKLIIYAYGENSRHRPGRSYFIEPISMKSYYQKTH